MLKSLALPRDACGSRRCVPTDPVGQFPRSLRLERGVGGCSARDWGECENNGVYISVVWDFNQLTIFGIIRTSLRTHLRHLFPHYPPRDEKSPKRSCLAVRRFRAFSALLLGQHPPGRRLSGTRWQQIPGKANERNSTGMAN